MAMHLKMADVTITSFMKTNAKPVCVVPSELDISVYWCFQQKFGPNWVGAYKCRAYCEDLALKLFGGLRGEAGGRGFGNRLLPNAQNADKRSRL